MLKLNDMFGMVLKGYLQSSGYFYIYFRKIQEMFIPDHWYDSVRLDKSFNKILTFVLFLCIC